MIHPSTIQFSGALAAHRYGLWEALFACGYSPLSALNVLRVAAHLSRWLQEQEQSLDALTHERIQAFFDARRAAGYTHFLTPRSLEVIVRHLEAVGAICLPLRVPALMSPVDQLVQEYRDYLRRERGLSAGSVRAYGDIADRFARSCLGEEPDAIEQLRAKDLTSFMLPASSRYGVGTTKYIVTVLRSFVRYLYVCGYVGLDLTGALPAVAGWRLSSLPKALDSVQVRQLLGACDRRRHIGRRDYAVILLMVRMGLRRGEVARLELDDVDWRMGEFIIHGKGPRDERLPLPADVGEALAVYLRRSRLSASTRRLFLNVRAPHTPLTSCGVGAIVCRALKRAGMPGNNSHRLRHTAATQMLRAGASLDEIAQVLRHRSHDTTAIYAKVDRSAWREVIRPWPGAAS